MRPADNSERVAEGSGALSCAGDGDTTGAKIVGTGGGDARSALSRVTLGEKDTRKKVRLSTTKTCADGCRMHECSKISACGRVDEL